MAVAKVSRHVPLEVIDVPVQKSALVIGGGAAGISAALCLASQGFPVHLVEKQAQLGGHLNQLFSSLDGCHPREILADLLQQVAQQPLIQTHLASKVIGTSGFKGNFTSQVENSQGDVTSIRHGATILATGGAEYRGPDYGLGSHPGIITQLDLERTFAEETTFKTTPQDGSVVMIQCIGPAEQYCSRTCCTQALKNALALKKIAPDLQIHLLYRDIRVYGEKEQLYTDARDQGVLFFRYDEDHKPQVKFSDPDGELQVLFRDPALDRSLAIKPDLVVLSTPITPQEDMKKLANLFKVSLDQDGFFLEAHVKLRPVDFSTEGIFMAGLAHYPKLIEESIIQAQAAASRAAIILSQDTLKAGGSVAVVTQNTCTGCLTCVRVCPFDVPVIQKDSPGAGEILGAAYIEPAVCQGCGICVAECPAQAIDLLYYTNSQLKAKVEALLNPADLTLHLI